MTTTSGRAGGVDLGTTETKAVLTTPDGRTVGYARRPTTWHRTADGRCESTGAALTGDVLATVKDALAGYQDQTGRPTRVAALGIAGLAESGVLLDAHGRESAPVIAWFDDRGAAELRAQDPGFLDSFPARTGLPVGAQWTLAKLLWLRSTGVRVDASSRWLNVPEFVAWVLTGQQVSEPSLASRTALLDQATSQPWADALALLGATADLLPDQVPAGTAAGRIGRCAELPALVGAVVTVAGHDHPVAAVGAGATGPEDLFNSCGTAEVLVRSVPRVLTDAERTTLVGAGIDAGPARAPRTHHAARRHAVRAGDEPGPHPDRRCDSRDPRRRRRAVAARPDDDPWRTRNRRIAGRQRRDAPAGHGRDTGRRVGRDAGAPGRADGSPARRGHRCRR
jgi:sugar (pentulose or hexulose) kinase